MGIANQTPPEVNFRSDRKELLRLINWLRKQVGTFSAASAFWVSEDDPSLTNQVNIGALPAPGGLLKVTIVGGYATPSIAVANIDFPSTNAYYVVTRATNAPPNATNLGAQATGVLQQTVTAGVSTPSALALATGEVLFGGSNALIDQSPYFFFDDANTRLCVGSSVPLGIIHGVGVSSGIVGAIVQNGGSDGVAAIRLANDTGVTSAGADATASMYYTGTTYTGPPFADVQDPVNACVFHLPNPGIPTGGGGGWLWRQGDIVPMRLPWIDGSISELEMLVSRPGEGGGRSGLKLTNNLPVSAQVFLTGDANAIDGPNLLISRFSGDYILDTGDVFVTSLVAGGIVYSDPATPGGILSAGQLKLVTLASTFSFSGGTLDLSATGVTPGSYTNTDLTVDAYGRITAASSGSGGGGGGVASVSGTPPIDSTGGANPIISLRYDNVSIDLTGGSAIRRAALTGDITATAGSNTTAFRTFAATSVLGRSANSTGAPADIAASADGNVLWRNGTTLAFAALPYSKITGVPVWPATGRVLVSAGTATDPTGFATLTFASNVLKVGDGTTAAFPVSVSAAASAGVWLAYKDATPTRAAAFGSGVPSAAPTDDAVFSTYNGSAWSERGRFVNAGTLQVVSLAGGSDALTYGTAASGALTRVTLGSGLSFTGGTLSATGSGGTVTNVTATPPVNSSGGTTPNITLSYDGVTLGLAAGTLERKALTGAITASDGSNSTFFGAMAALSVLANATNASAVPTAFAAGTSGDVLWRNGTALVWSHIPVASVTGAQPTITWPTATQILISSGTSTDPVGDSAFTYATADDHMRNDGPITINSAVNTIGAGYLVTVAKTSTRDRVWWGLAGNAVTDGVNREWMTISPASTTISTNAITLMATFRVRAPDYTLSGVAAGTIASVFADQPTFNGGTVSDPNTSAWVYYAAGGTTSQSKFEGAIVSNSIATGLGQFAGDGSNVFNLPVDNTGNTSAAVGRVPVVIAGITRYLRYYND